MDQCAMKDDQTLTILSKTSEKNLVMPFMQLFHYEKLKFNLHYLKPLQLWLWPFLTPSVFHKPPTPLFHNTADLQICSKTRQFSFFIMFPLWPLQLLWLFRSPNPVMFNPCGICKLFAYVYLIKWLFVDVAPWRYDFTSMQYDRWSHIVLYVELKILLQMVCSNKKDFFFI